MHITCPTTALKEDALDTAKRIKGWAGEESFLVVTGPELYDAYSDILIGELDPVTTALKVLWQNNYQIPNAGEASSVYASYTRKSKNPPALALILNPLNDNAATLRTRIFYALDQQIALNNIYIVGPKVLRAVLDEVCSDFGYKFKTDFLIPVDEQAYAQWKAFLEPLTTLSAQSIPAGIEALMSVDFE